MQVDMLDDDGLDRVCEFLGVVSEDDEVDVYLGTYPRPTQVALLAFVSELLRESSSANGRTDNPVN